MKRITIFSSILLCFGSCDCQVPFFIPNKGFEITIQKFSKGSSGYYFTAPSKNFQPSATTSHMLILDEDLNVAFYKPIPKPEKQAGISGMVLDFKMNPCGLMSYFYNDGKTSAFYLMDSTFWVIDTLTCINHPSDPHSLLVLKDRSYYITCNDSRVTNLSDDTMYQHMRNKEKVNIYGTGTVIQHISKDKRLLFEWNAFDHCAYNEELSDCLNNDSVVDWGHGNSIRLSDDGNLIVSFRNFGSVFKISSTTGKVLWRLGGKRSDFSFPDDIGFTNQHDATMKGDTLSVYDNGTCHNPPLSRIVDYIIDTAKSKATPVFIYKNDNADVSNAQGSYQVLPDGNRLISWGAGKTLLKWAVTEIGINGDKKFQFQFSPGFQTFRTFFGIPSWSLKRPVITGFEKGHKLYLDAGAGYDKYYWSNGAHTRIIRAVKGKKYQVFVNYGSGEMGSLIYDAKQPENHASLQKRSK